MKSDRRFPHNARCTCPDPHGRGCDCRSCQLEDVADRQKRWLVGCEANAAMIAAMKVAADESVFAFFDTTTGDVVRVTTENVDYVLRRTTEEAAREREAAGKADYYNFGFPMYEVDFEPVEPAGMSTLHQAADRDEKGPVKRSVE